MTTEISKKYESYGGLSISNQSAYMKIWVAKNKEKRSAALKRYAEKNRDKMRAKGMRRYASQTKQTPPWINKAHEAEIEGYYLFCRIFNQYKSDKKDKFQVDHIVPIRGKEVSGLHVPWNLEVITSRENVSKGNFLKPGVYPQQGQCAFTED